MESAGNLKRTTTGLYLCRRFWSLRLLVDIAGAALPLTMFTAIYTAHWHLFFSHNQQHQESRAFPSCHHKLSLPCNQALMESRPKQSTKQDKRAKLILFLPRHAVA